MACHKKLRFDGGDYGPMYVDPHEVAVVHASGLGTGSSRIILKGGAQFAVADSVNRVMLAVEHHFWDCENESRSD